MALVTELCSEVQVFVFLVRNGNFSVRRQPGFFNTVAPDQCIEQTINREQKRKGGMDGHSTSAGTVQRWVLNQSLCGKFDFAILIFTR